MAANYTVIFQPSGRRCTVAEGQTLLEAARLAGLELTSPCGGQRTCGNCRVQVTSGRPPVPAGGDSAHIKPEDVARGVRLACETRVDRDMTVVVPRETMVFDQQILETGLDVQVDLDPNVRRVHLELSPPSIEDQRSDGDRALDALAEDGLQATMDLRLAREFPSRLRQAEFAGTAVVLGDKLVSFEPGDSSAANFGVAVDVGTTTVVAALMDLNTGRQRALASAANPQSSYGDDVISRITFASQSPASLRQIQASIVGCLNRLIDDLCRQADLQRAAIHELAVVGNTTMTHLLLRIDPAYIAQAPFTAALRHGMAVDPRELGLKINTRGQVYVAPNIAGFVGADTVGVLLATGLYRSSQMQLMIDIGTNGELVLGNRDRLLACSTAAGPAFEGARIQHGMRAAAGAIDRVEIVDGQLQVHTIGDALPVGLCGTGIIEALAVLLDLGIVSDTGRMLAPADVPGLSPELAARVVDGEGRLAFVLAEADESGTGHRVVLTQKDVREVQLAKAAMHAGAMVLMAELGVKPADLDAVLLAGAFGNFIRPDRAARIGLLPAAPLERVKFVGNAACTGARILLLNRGLRQVAEEVSRRVEHVELSARLDFQNLYAESMMFE